MKGELGRIYGVPIVTAPRFMRLRAYLQPWKYKKVMKGLWVKR